MPTLPPRACAHAGCRAFAVRAGLCQEHLQVKASTQRQDDRRRGSAHERGYTSAWRKARAAFLRAHPLCRACERQGLLVPASVVDHVIPHRGDELLFWNQSNWQPLCKPCHDAKTATEDGGFGNPARQQG